MNEQADDLERIAENSERNVEIIKKNLKVFEDKSFKEIGAVTGDVQDISDISISPDIEKRITEIEENQKTIINLLNKNKEERREYQLKIDENTNLINKFQEGKGQFNQIYGEINSLRNDPLSFGKGKIKGLLGKAGIYGAVAMFAWEMGEKLYNQIVNEVKSMYGKGGVFDIRKQVRDQVTEYNSIKYLEKIRSGQVIFTADAGQDLVQGAVRGAYNTRDLRDGHLRYFQLKRGS
jgi:hypothetical protein